MKRTSYFLKIVGVTVIALFLTLAFAQRHPLDLENAKDRDSYKVVWSEASVDEIRVWLESGNDVNARDLNGWTPLMWAAFFNDDVTVTTALLDAGADTDARDKHGNTPLIHATRNSNISVLEVLLESGADVNTQGYLGYTPLMIAVSHAEWFYGDPDVITMLLNAGADTNIRDNRGKSALYRASFDSDAFSAIVQAGAEVNTRDEFGRTPLVNAVLAKAHEAVILLLEAGVDVSLKDNGGKTALDYANDEDSFAGTEAYQRLLEATR